MRGQVGTFENSAIENGLLVDFVESARFGEAVAQGSVSRLQRLQHVRGGGDQMGIVRGPALVLLNNRN